MANDDFATTASTRTRNEKIEAQTNAANVVGALSEMGFKPEQLEILSPGGKGTPMLIAFKPGGSIDFANRVKEMFEQSANEAGIAFNSEHRFIAHRGDSADIPILGNLGREEPGARKNQAILEIDLPQVQQTTLLEAFKSAKLAEKIQQAQLLERAKDAMKSLSDKAICSGNVPDGTNVSPNSCSGPAPSGELRR